MSIEEGRKRNKLESNDRKELVSPVLGYLSEKSKTLLNDYRTPDGNYSKSCSLIAVDIAKMLLEEGKRPEIVSITGKRIDNPNIIVHEPLKPVQYEGRVSWGGHTVCVCDGLVYDPMIGRPLPIEEYAHKAFGADVEMSTVVPENKIEKFVNR